MTIDIISYVIAGIICLIIGIIILFIILEQKRRTK